MKYLLIIAMSLLLFSCGNGEDKADAFGNFEAVETIISAEASGKLVEFILEEGDKLEKDQFVGLVDTTQLFLKKEQLEASINTIKTKYQSVIAQVEVIEEQRKNALKDKERIEKMFADKAATQKQVDDINGAISVLDRQMDQIETQNSTIFSELKGLDIQLLQVEDLLDKSKIINPINGTVLVKYAEQDEITGAGKPLYKIANLEKMILRAYISGAQLSEFKIGDEVKVSYIAGEDKMNETTGRISWISSKAEFTPKIIQTREESVSMVYAVKIMVDNKGEIKIGMPGEVRK
jgi:HlyD family secretion protein